MDQRAALGTPGGGTRPTSARVLAHGCFHTGHLGVLADGHYSAGETRPNTGQIFKKILRIIRLPPASVGFRRLARGFDFFLGQGGWGEGNQLEVISQIPTGALKDGRKYGTK